MKLTSLKRFLSSINVPLNQWIQTDYIDCINLENHGNYHYNSLTEHLYFDSENELLKVKIYDKTVSSSRFSQWENAAGYIRTTTRMSLKHSKYPFRNPHAGDYIFFINKKKDERSSFYTKIQSMSVKDGYVTFITEKTIPSNYVQLDYIACYADGETFLNSAESLFDKSLLFHSTPRSNFVADVYIDMEMITGISLSSELSISI